MSRSKGPPSYVIYNWKIHQRRLEHESPLWSKLRNFHSGNYFTRWNPDGAASHSWKVFITIANLAAEAINATLIAYGHPKYNLKKYPLFTPIDTLFTRSISESNWKTRIFKLKRDSQPERVSYVATELKWDLNFLYCAPIQRLQASTSDFTFIFTPFDKLTWFLIFVFAVLITFLAFRKYRGTSSYSEMVLHTFSTLLSPICGMSRLSNKSQGGYLNIIVLWMFSTLIIITLYSGVLTSLVVRPAPEYSIATVDDLQLSKYNLRSSCDTVKALKNNFGEMSGTDKYLITPKFQTIQKLLTKTNCIRNFKRADEIEEFILRMLHLNHTATLMWAHATFSRATLINDLVAGRSIANLNIFIPKKYRGKKCYVGKELIGAGQSFIGAIPPGSIYVTQGLQKLVQAGIVTRWIQEFHQMHWAERVQDRNRFVTSTSVIPEREDEDNMKLKGKVVAIFVLWSVCCGASFLAFIFECFYRKMGKEPMLIIRNLD